jgi:hypothetical protein
MIYHGRHLSNSHFITFDDTGTRKDVFYYAGTGLKWYGPDLDRKISATGPNPTSYSTPYLPSTVQVPIQHSGTVQSHYKLFILSTSQA